MIATSLLSGTAWSQSPRPGDQPAPTSWQPFKPPSVPAPPQPQMVVPTQPVLPQVVQPQQPPLPQAVAPPRMITYQKPPSETRAQPTARANETMLLPPLPGGLPDKPVQAKPAVLVKQPPPVQPPPPMPVQPPPPTPVPAPTTPATEDQMKLRSSTGGIPTKAELFRLDSDTALNARIVRELGKVISEPFPPTSTLSAPGAKYEPKTLSYEPRNLLIEPNYVIHRRLYFEEKNAERAGWDAGPAQGLFSTLYFFRDGLLFPSRIGSGVHDCYDSSAGKCMPGAPTPYYYYPPGVTTFGGVVGATAITAAALVVFP